MEQINLTEKRLELLDICHSQGYLLLEDGLEIYQHLETVSRTVNELENKGLLELHDAPEVSTKKKVWDITDKGKVFTNIE